MSGQQLDRELLAGLYQFFDEADGELSLLMHWLQSLLEELKIIHPKRVHQIKLRRKTVKSLFNKIKENDSVALSNFGVEQSAQQVRQELFSNISDVVAGRIIVFEPSQLVPVHNYLLSNDNLLICHVKGWASSHKNSVKIFQQIEVEAKNKGIKYISDSQDSDYMSIHYICMPPSRLGLSKDYRLEIQLRTILREAWSETVHGLVYKGSSTDNEASRLTGGFNVISGMLDQIDWVFAESKRQTMDQLDAKGEPLAQHRSFYKKARVLTQGDDTLMENVFEFLDENNSEIKIILCNDKAYYESLEIAYLYLLVEEVKKASEIYVNFYKNNKHRKDPWLLVRYAEVQIKIYSAKSKEAQRIGEELFGSLDSLLSKGELSPEETLLIRSSAYVLWQLGKSKFALEVGKCGLEKGSYRQGDMGSSAKQNDLLNYIYYFIEEQNKAPFLSPQGFLSHLEKYEGLIKGVLEQGEIHHAKRWANHLDTIAFYCLQLAQCYAKGESDESRDKIWENYFIAHEASEQSVIWAIENDYSETDQGDFKKQLGKIKEFRKQLWR